MARQSASNMAPLTSENVGPGLYRAASLVMRRAHQGDAVDIADDRTGEAAATQRLAGSMPGKVSRRSSASAPGAQIAEAPPIAVMAARALENKVGKFVSGTHNVVCVEEGRRLSVANSTLVQQLTASLPVVLCDGFL